MDTAAIVKPVTYPREICCAHCAKRPLAVDDTWEIYGLSPVCGPCARERSIPKDRFRCVPCEECQHPTANTLFDARGLFVCGSCHKRQRQQSPAQSPGASHAPASATASAAPAGAAAGDRRLAATVGLCLLIWLALFVWIELIQSAEARQFIGQVAAAMAPTLAVFSILLALGIGWMLRSFSHDLRDTATGGPDADSQPTAHND